MADGTRTVPGASRLRVRLSLRSALAVVFALGATVLLLEVLQNAERVIGWVLTAIAVAALVYPAVVWLSHFRFVPRGVAVLITVLVALGTIGFLGYRIVNDVSNAMSSLQDAAPKRAAQLEHDSDFWREIKLKQRVTTLVDEIPNRLAGGEPTEALKTNVSRGVAFLAGTILTIFFILYGERIIEGGLGLIDDPDARRRTEYVFRDGSKRALFHARVKLWEATVEGLLAYTIARAAGVPGAAALAVWVALWSLLPVAGVVIGALPIIVFAGALSMTRAVVVTIAFVAIGAADYVVNRWLARRTFDVGSFAIVLAAFGGLEFYGFMGALLFVFGAIFAVAIISEIGPEEVAEVLAAQAKPEGDTGETIVVTRRPE
jgi:predicted PurR-regulated permease PerM